MVKLPILTFEALMNITQKIQILMPHRSLLRESLMGIEKEGLRVCKKGDISQTPHPAVFGCALTHPNITTDFSESLTELVTPPLKNTAEMLRFLADTQQYLYQHLPPEQNFWPASMPCVIRGETTIPIAQYGSSNQGMMKTVYRRGLANRYGSVMQTIAGVHFNYSFSQDFFQQYQLLMATDKTLRDFTDCQYMGVARNVVRYGWIIPYLFGASPAVCKSFLKDYHQYSLIEFNHSTLYEPYATSLRMGDIGYQNLREDNAGVKANYNSLVHYISSLKMGMLSNCPEYEAIGIKKNGSYQQLNTNILQIENEYYATVRPKPLVQTDKKPLDSLQDSGIAYIELRSLDINPLLPLGVNQQQIHFLQGFLLFCLLKDSPAISTREQFDIDSNDQLVAHEGRKPGLLLKRQSAPILLQDWGNQLAQEISSCAQLLGTECQTDIAEISKRFDCPALTPSARSLQLMRDKNQGFFDYINAFAKQYKTEFLNKEIRQTHFDYLDKQAQLSCEKQSAIEAADSISFDEFLAQYFRI